MFELQGNWQQLVTSGFDIAPFGVTSMQLTRPQSSLRSAADGSARGDGKEESEAERPSLLLPITPHAFPGRTSLVNINRRLRRLGTSQSMQGMGSVSQTLGTNLLLCIDQSVNCSESVENGQVCIN